MVYYKLPYNTKFRKVILEKCTLDGRDPLRKYAYIDLKTDKVYRLYDSLCGPIYPIQSNRSAFELNSEQKALPFNDYRTVVDAHYDSIYKNIMTYKNPEIDRFYRKIDSLKYIDSTEAFALLANTNYELYCAKYLLKQMAKERPELLIRYIDKHYTNRDIVLKAVRNHSYFRQITRNVKACSAKKAPGKTMLVSQRTNRVVRDVAAGTLYTVILLAELSIIPLLIIISRN